MECTFPFNIQQRSSVPTSSSVGISPSNYHESSLATIELIDKLTAKIIRIFDDDKTIEFQARGLAWYILCVKHISYATFCDKLDKNPNTKVYLTKLMDCQSEFSTVLPLSIGIDHISNLASGRMQKSLDAKHLRKNNETAELTQDAIIPDIKHNILYSHGDFVWIRFFARDDVFMSELQTLLPQCKLSYCRLSDDVYELYIRKSDWVVAKLIAVVDSILEYLDRKKNDIVFCSELILFKYNTQLFISNFVKFMFCYSQSKVVFELESSEDYITFNHYLLNCCLFLFTKNLANMNDETHSPLNNYTAERPSVLLNKNKDSKIHIVEGNRPLLSTDKQSDIGTTSTRIELVHSVALDDTKIDKII